MPLDVGIRYSPTIILDNDIEQIHWSVIFTVTPIENDRTSKINFQLLADNECTHQLQEKLLPGTRFRLHEGKCIVAVGVVT